MVLLVVSGYLVFGGKSKTETDETSQDQSIQTISAEELGLTITPSSDKKKVKFGIEHPQGIKSIEYSLTYEADSTSQEIEEGGEPRVQRGITGETEIKTDSKPYESEFLDLGSCSKNVCRYDTGVNSVELTLKIVKSDGKTYQSEKKAEF